MDDHEIAPAARVFNVVIWCRNNNGNPAKRETGGNE